LNIVFAGTPHFTLPCLDALFHSEHSVTAVYTQPDRPSGRGHQPQATPVKLWAEKHGLPVYQPIDFKKQQSIDELAALAPDILVVIAYGLILPQAVLTIPRHGCINVHASLLPRWRGASPIQQAILHQDQESGITLMKMDKGMDTGPVFKTVSCRVEPFETAGTLHDKLAQLATKPLLTLLDDLSTRHLTPEPQNHHLATYAPKISKGDAAINWQLSAKAIDSQIRAFNPWPIAYTHTKESTVRVHKARVINTQSHAVPGTIIAINKDGISVATGDQTLLIEQLQFAGGKAMSVKDWQNSNHRQLEINVVLK